jgi:hypothetical protein
MNSVLHSFDIAFPLKFGHRKKPLRSGWIVQGIKMYSKKNEIFKHAKETT